MQYLLLIFVALANGEHFKTNMLENRTTIVHLFEWKWKDIADECEKFLAPEGYGGVQISPPSENLIIHTGDGKRPWYERYQVMSYKLETRSGNEEDFLNMTTRCNNVGVRVTINIRCNTMLKPKRMGLSLVVSSAGELGFLDSVPQEANPWPSQSAGDVIEVRHRRSDLNFRIYADVVVNHMTGSHKDNIGTGGSTADLNKYSYPAVPYIEEHFHPFCIINNYYNAAEVRNCQLLGLKDLNQTEVYVRNRIVSYVNKLIKFGVAGVRIDAAKHMWPSDLKEIYTRFDNLNPHFGFPGNTRPYIYQEVIYHGGEPIRPEEYTPLGDVTEFRVGSELKNVFRGYNNMKWLVNWGEPWGLSSGNTALVFVDNHDNQRSSDVLTYKEAKAYKAAIAFMLAHPYGKPRIMSSYAFTTSDQGPPSDGHENILSPIINKSLRVESVIESEINDAYYLGLNGFFRMLTLKIRDNLIFNLIENTNVREEDDTCGNGWVCEHRWRQIYQMVGFRNVVINTKLNHWWDNGNKQIAFGRGGKGFIVFNGDSFDLNNTLQTGLPAGEYCDIISGTKVGSSCTGKIISVNNKGMAYFFISPHTEDMFMAIHVGEESKIETKRTNQENFNIMCVNVV